MKEDANDPGFGDEDSIDVTHRTEDGNYSLYTDSPNTFPQILSKSYIINKLSNTFFQNFRFKSSSLSSTTTLCGLNKDTR